MPLWPSYRAREIILLRSHDGTTTRSVPFFLRFLRPRRRGEAPPSLSSSRRSGGRWLIYPFRASSGSSKTLRYDWSLLAPIPVPPNRKKVRQKRHRAWEKFHCLDSMGQFGMSMFGCKLAARSAVQSSSAAEELLTKSTYCAFVL